MVPEHVESFSSSPTAAPSKGRFLLLDGHSLAYRAFYALPTENFSTTTGQHTNAVYGFIAMLINLLRDEQPTHVAVAFDVSRHTFRTQQFPQYKANRKASPQEFSGQVALIKEVLSALAIPSVEVENFEADDIIATLSTHASVEGLDVLITTGDRDAFQLVSPSVTVLYPKRGVSQLERMTPQAVEQRYGLTPQQYPDFAALRGDPSDNLPSVAGVGEKTATKWIVEFGSLQQLLDQAERIKGKVGVALRENIQQVRMNRQLTQLVTDVPLPVQVADMRRSPWDREAVHQIFDALEFRVLRDRLYALTEQQQQETDQVVQVNVQQFATGELGVWLHQCATFPEPSPAAEPASGPPVQPTGIHVVGHWQQGRGEAIAVALGRPNGQAIFVPIAELDPHDHHMLVQWLTDPTFPKAMHESKNPLHALRDSGLIGAVNVKEPHTSAQVAGLWCDTAVAAYLLRPDQRSYDLADLVVRHLGRQLHQTEREQAASSPVNSQLQLSLEEPPGQEEHQQACISATAVAQLAGQLMAALQDSEQETLMRQVEVPLVPVLAKLERVGIAVDRDLLGQLDAHFADEVATAAERAYAVIGKQINLSSPKQLQVVLFDELGMPKTKRTKTGWTTDADALQTLFAKTEHPFLQHLLHHRDASRMKVTTEGLLKSVSDDGRIHTTYNQTIAATGRLSSNDPNLQNIPIRTEQGRRIRSTFVVSQSSTPAKNSTAYECLMTADYSQIEMRIMAHLSKDEELIAAFTSGEDLHTTVASKVFAVPEGQVSPTQRSRIKAMSYGLAYGLSNFGLSQQLGVSPAAAQEMMDEYFLRFGGIRDYLHGVVEQARRTGYTATVLGRRRYLPDLTSDNRQRREIAQRMALNAPIQGSAADIIKLAMLATEDSLRQHSLSSRMLLQVHDELVLEVATGEREQVKKLVTHSMSQAWPLTVPLTVSVGFGRSWHEAAH